MDELIIRKEKGRKEKNYAIINIKGKVVRKVKYKEKKRKFDGKY